LDDLDRARLQDFYDELERFRAVFNKAQALVAPMIGEDAGRLDAMGKAIRKLYGPAVEPLMAHVDEVLAHARRMVEPLPENPLHKAFERRSGADRRKADRPQLGPSFRAPVGAATPLVEAVPLPAPDRRFSDADLPTLRTRALRPREIPMPVPRNGHPSDDGEETEVESPARAAIRGFAATNPEPRPPRPPTVSQTAPSVRREIPRPPAAESEIRITYEDPGGWGVL
jgi:hypothetical protein